MVGFFRPFVNRLPATARGYPELPERRDCLTAVTKTVRLSGGSERSIEDAISTVLARAAVSIADIAKFDVVRLGGTVSGSGVPATFEVTLDITFTVRENP